MGKLKRLIVNIYHNVSDDKAVFTVFIVLRILALLALIRQVFNQNYEAIGVCLIALLLALIPSIIENRFYLKIPPLFEIAIYIFIFAAEILGEVNNFYVNIPGWDSILHTLNGFLCAALGFSLVDLFNRRDSKFFLSPLYLTLMGFCFSMTVGVLWEFAECFGDLYLGMDAQKDFIVTSFNSVTLDPTHSQIPIKVRDIVSTEITLADGSTITIDGGYLDIGLLDTMKDLFVNFIGAICFSIIGYFYITHRKGGAGMGARIAEALIVQHESDDIDEIYVMSDGLADGFRVRDSKNEREHNNKK